jgi:hypothetical protein
MRVRTVIGLILLAVLLSSCNALCFMSMDPTIPGQSGDDMLHPAWYGFDACRMGDVLP